MKFIQKPSFKRSTVFKIIISLVFVSALAFYFSSFIAQNLRSYAKRNSNDDCRENNSNRCILKRALKQNTIQLSPARSPSDLPRITPNLKGVIIREDFDSSNGFGSRLIDGKEGVASWDIQNGLLHISHKPNDWFSGQLVYKSYSVDLSKPTWFNFRFKMGEYLLGQDMYTTIEFFAPNNPKSYKMSIGINSEQHWERYIFKPGMAACTEKTKDDEFFIQVSPEIFPNATDVRIPYPKNYSKNYTEWTTFSMKYDPPNGPIAGKFSYYVDGKLVDNMHALDDSVPKSVINTSTNFFAKYTNTDILVTQELLVDGWIYSYPSNRWGTRGIGCYSVLAPGKPSMIRIPKKYETPQITSGYEFKTDWMKKFDSVAAIYMDILTDYTKGKSNIIGSYKTPHSSVSLWTDEIKPYDPVHFYYRFADYNTDAALQEKINQIIREKIFSGSLDLSTVILMGIMPLPSATDTIWNNNTQLYTTISQQLQKINDKYSGWAAPRRFVWDRMEEKDGDILDIVHLGYLTTEEVMQSPIYSNLSSEEKNQMPEASTPKEAHFYWDYFEISSKPPTIN